MQNMKELLVSIRASGFKLPHEQGLFAHPLLDANGAPIDPREHGFNVAHTGGGCEALELELGEFLIMITCDGGSSIPDQDEWAESLIGIYLINDDRDEVALLTGLEWQELVIAATAQPLSSTGKQ